MRKRFNHKRLQLFLLGLIIAGFVVFALFNIVSTGNPVKSVSLEGEGGVVTSASSFQQIYGKEWKVELGKETNIPSKLAGGNIPIEQITGKKESINKDNIDTISKTFLDKNKDFLKADSSTLKTSKVFSNPNSKTKVIRYKQQYQGVPIYNSYTTIAYSGDALTFYKTNYDTFVQVNTVPSITKEKALDTVKRDLSILRNANGFYSTSTNPGFSVLANDISGGNQPETWVKRTTEDNNLRTIKLNSINVNYVKNLNPEKTELVIFPLNIVNQKGHKLAWKIDLPLNTEEGEKFTYFVNAVTGEVIYKFDNIVYATVSGNVQGKIYPETPTDGFEIKPFNHERVRFVGDVNYTDNGNYAINTEEPSGEIYSELEGLYANVDNYKQPRAYFQSNIINPPATQDIDWSLVDTSYKQEESNVFYHFNFVHDYFTRGGAFDIYDMDNIKMTATVEVPGSYCGVGYDYCNACAGGDVMFFFGAGEVPGFGYCEATSLGSDIIYHEYTHNVVFSIYNVLDLPYWDQTGGMNEGWADYFASTITNDPLMGENIFPEPIRNANNTLRYPEDYNPEPHAASEVFTPALWEIRQAIGAEAADVLVLSAMKLTPMSFSEFLEAMIIVDDDNGNLDDGTPHINNICHAFVDNHGIASSFCAGYTQDPLAIITEPKKLDDVEILITNFADNITIKGVAYNSMGAVFEYYKVEYAPYDDQSVWTEIITSSIPVVNDVLAVWDIRGISQDQSYLVRLIVKDSRDQTETSIKIQAPPAKLTREYYDYGEDTNNNGLYDYLVINVGVRIIEGGVFTLTGTFSAPSLPPNKFFEVFNRSHLSPGIYNISLRFYGKDLYRTFYSGEYNVAVELIDNNWSRTLERANYITTPYDYTQFEIPPPDIIGYMKRGAGPSETFINHAVNITAVVYNDGGRDINGAWASLYDEIAGSSELLENTPIGNISGFSKVEVNYTWVPRIAGYHNLKLVVGASNDADAWNNVNYWSYRVFLNISDVTGEIYLNDLPLVNVPHPLVVMVRNDDYITAKDVYASVYYYLPNSEKVLLGEEYVGNVTSNGFYFFIVPWMPEIVGEYVIGLELNSTNDGNLDNNKINITIDIAPLINVTFYATNSTDEYAPLGVGVGYGNQNIIYQTFGINSLPDVITLPDTKINLFIIRFEEGEYNLEFINSIINETMGVVSEVYEDEKIVNGLKMYSIYANKVSWDYESAHMTMTFLDEFFPQDLDSRLIRLYTCPKWNFGSQECYSKWKSETVNVDGPYGWVWLSGFVNKSEALGIGEAYLCADLNHDGVRDVIDVVKLVDYAFRNGVEPQPKWIGDLNGDGVIDVIDVVKLVDYAFRGGSEPTCTSQPIVTSSSATASLGSATGTTTKTIPVNLANTENVAGATFTISYDTMYGYLKDVKVATGRAGNMNVVRNGNTFTLIDQSGSNVISKGSGAIVNLYFTSGKKGLNLNSLKITEVKAANPKANKISVKIETSSTGVKSGATLI